jgi:cellulose synthase/poly-beta-1,6-N-acetylglucosamine synthase-like glycosyltransferase
VSAFLFWLALITFVAVLLGVLETAIGVLSLPRLDRETPVEAGRAPMLSVVVAARDEAAEIERALRSLLALDYPRLEVVAVDDRSEDATPSILARIAAEDPRLRVIRVERLPEGWLGKNHALHLGSEAAAGELLLFTDADVVMAPELASRAIGLMEREGLDHLTVPPRVELPTLPSRVFGAAFGVFFNLYARPWRMPDPRSQAVAGIGAFNLVRASAYRTIGGHRHIALKVDDDMWLGRRLKQEGHRGAMAVAPGMMSVRWYDSLGGMVRGLSKNMFAGQNYRVPVVVGATFALLLVYVWPPLSIPFVSGWTLALNAASSLLLAALFVGSAAHQRMNPLYGLAYPLSTLIFAFTMWRSMIVTLRQGGVEWRGTHYPLDQLRR